MFLYSLQGREAYLEPSRIFMMELFYKNSKSLTIFVKISTINLTEFQIRLRYIAQSLFRTQLNIYDGAFLQK